MHPIKIECKSTAFLWYIQDTSITFVNTNLMTLDY